MGGGDFLWLGIALGAARYYLSGET